MIFNASKVDISLFDENLSIDNNNIVALELLGNLCEDNVLHFCGTIVATKCDQVILSDIPPHLVSWVETTLLYNKVSPLYFYEGALLSPNMSEVISNLCCMIDELDETSGDIAKVEEDNSNEEIIDVSMLLIEDEELLSEFATDEDELSKLYVNDELGESNISALDETVEKASFSVVN